MGVPKFFRYISERYPCLSELVKDYQIPEFDNLYLDMNGIIHMCSHPNDFDPHFRISEERIFKDIFHYLEILFQMIKPRKLFFMAVDGVAPRAKMNQQRGRRFRSAKEAEVLEKRAEAKGEKLPSEARFDSNCITPGTVFMARLHEQLKYFVTSKMTCDKQWKGVKVILSGHETPGEGEHKIMEYIRWMKTHPDYDHNTRHCLYGLDADLMMLGLCTHEPHFSLLREEVKFGKQSKRTSVPEETRFYLLHLSLMREYLNLEFNQLKDKLNFPYDVESIIDDWVLMGFLVGNDFIPHLPDVHIASGALPMLYNAYMEVLPTLEGYINENGYLRLDRFQKFMEKLSAFDINQFKDTYADVKYFESKTNRKMGSNNDHTYENGNDGSNGSKSGNPELDALIKATNAMVLEKFFDDGEDGDTGIADEEEDDVDIFGSRVYDDDSDLEVSDTFLLEFHQHKKDYYRNKLEYGKVTEKVLKDQAEGYVRAIQWNLHYYYHGVASWSWYYPHHYAPYVSDICNFKDVDLTFDLGEPFKPFEQLLAVLPAASKKLLPEPYQKLMIQECSSILEYYPADFETDLNGKKQDWEAVVLIPFIDEQRLLSAMKPCGEMLADEEKNRNKFGPMLVYTYSNESLGEYKAPDYFSPIKDNRAQLKEVWREELHLSPQKIVHGLLPGVRLDVYFPGFPTFNHLPYTGELRKAKVQVFDQASRGDNMIITLLNVRQKSSLSLKETAEQYLGKDVYCGWPHLSEAKVVGVADGTKRYNLLSSGKFALENLQNTLAAQCEAVKKALGSQYMRRQGVDIGNTQLVVYVQHVAGRKYVFGQAGKITLEKMYSEIQDTYALQTIVDDIAVHDSSFVQFRTLEQVFPHGSKCFLLARPVYGSIGEVLEVKKQPEGRLMIKISTNGEPNVDIIRQNQHSLKPQYMPGSRAAQHLGISPHILSRITGTIFLVVGNKQADNPSKVNIGLNLKFNKKNEEIPGFTRKENNMWLYSRKSIDLIREYVEKFPEVFEHLCKQTSDDVYDDKDMYPGDDCAEKVGLLTKWLKEIPSAGVDRRSCGAQVLDEEVVTKLQAAVEMYVENPPEFKRLTLQVKPHVVFKSELRVGNLAPDPTTTYQLFDRVVNVRDDSSVPLGLRGTIIGIHPSDKAEETMYDVLFDQEFPSGMSLSGSKKCSYRVSRTYLINISHGRRLGFISDSYWNCQSESRPNSAFASWSGKEKSGNHQANNWRSQCPNKNQTTTNQSSSKGYSDNLDKSKHFKFPAPPNVQILPSATSAVASKERMLWNQLQMVSGKNVIPNVHPAPPPPSALPIPDDNITNVIDTKTNVLKLMLGVEPLSVKETGKSLAAPAATASCGKDRIDRQSTQSCLVAQHAQDACSLLMDFFQRKGTGVPTYSVTTVGTELIAELRLPDGHVVCGKPAPTKQEATVKAATEALHLLQFCRVCKKEPSTQQQPNPVKHTQIPTGGQTISGQPQQFFQQFRQGRFPPPPQHPLSSGNPGWQQSGSNRQTLTRASFPQGPPPFPHLQFQVMQHPSSYQHPPPHLSHPHQYPQQAQPGSSYHQQLSPQKHQFQQTSNHRRREDVDGSNRHSANQRQHRHDQQSPAVKDPNSFVPLQAMKKQRNVLKSASLMRHEHQEKKTTMVAHTQELEHNKMASGSASRSKPEEALSNPVDKTNKIKKEIDNTGTKAAHEKANESSNRSESRMRKSRLAINFQVVPNQ